MWTQWPNEPIRAITDARGAPLEGVWPDLSDGTVTVTVAPLTAPGDPNDPIDVRLGIRGPIRADGRYDDRHRGIEQRSARRSRRAPGQPCENRGRG